MEMKLKYSSCGSCDESLIIKLTLGIHMSIRFKTLEDTEVCKYHLTPMLKYQIRYHHHSMNQATTSARAHTQS